MKTSDYEEESKERVEDFEHNRIDPSMAAYWKLKFQEVAVHFAGWYAFREVFTAWTDGELRDTIEWINDSR